ncbi:hypothetical protein [Synechococcus phage MinM1]|nr:hypothetical protein [Synechococcus phage MinM1]
MAKAVQATPGVVTKSRYAEHRGCSPAYVSKLIRLGRLAAPALLADGRVNIALADQMLGAPSADELALIATPSAPSHAQHRAEREAAQARIARVKAEELEGARLLRDRVEARVFDVCRRLRDELHAWPEVVAARLVAMTDDRAIADLLLAEIEDKLTRLAASLQDAISHDDDPSDEAEAA